MAGQRPYEVADRTRALDFGLLSHLQRIVDFDSEVANRTFQFRVPKQQLHRPQVLRPPIDQRSLGPAQCMRAIGGRI